MAVRVVTNDSIPQPENISDARIFAEDLRVILFGEPGFFPALCSEGILPSSAVFRDRSHQCFPPSTNHPPAFVFRLPNAALQFLIYFVARTASLL